MIAPGIPLTPKPMGAHTTITDLVDNYFLAYNAARLREACQLMASQILQPDVVVGVTLSGALTPAGFSGAVLAPLMEAGFIDWIVSTGANLYHDMHRSLGFTLFGSTPFVDDVALAEQGLIRIYDILFDQDVLYKTDRYIAERIETPEFQRRMGTAEVHNRLGRCLFELEETAGITQKSLLATAYAMGVPIYTSSPGDSSLGMNIAAGRLRGNALSIDAERDVNETAALVHHTKRNGKKSALVIFGGGSPKNFALQTEPQIREVLGLQEEGHDYYVQITDARPDTGGLSGATPSEAVTWGKVNPNQLPNTVVCYCDSTIALPILSAYVLSKVSPRPLNRLYDLRDEMLDNLTEEYLGTVHANRNEE